MDIENHKLVEHLTTSGMKKKNELPLNHNVALHVFTNNGTIFTTVILLCYSVAPIFIDKLILTETFNILVF